ncbi:hypothetical protein BCR33DRAFT_837155 [Rhizoclosmatium globosum]|uniref:Uncharacterized protein n=1 Tax=Rhizoclosmatium globosum TaxID=329046 RepID=A0A1Y2CVH8_9FUNG|nr:hypothetical protein BCR33DRAFT_837155 [Rhizoclosmatium globosum]|eukprot:ORY51023.1 hypothetical protein BCR33DRAFT_837155 [Rhizoclosmatium globosum]
MPTWKIARSSSSSPTNQTQDPSPERSVSLLSSEYKKLVGSAKRLRVKRKGQSDINSTQSELQQPHLISVDSSTHTPASAVHSPQTPVEPSATKFQPHVSHSLPIESSSSGDNYSKYMSRSEETIEFEDPDHPVLRLHYAGQTILGKAVQDFLHLHYLSF